MLLSKEYSSCKLRVKGILSNAERKKLVDILISIVTVEKGTNHEAHSL
jgi:hypothetical protein